MRARADAGDAKSEELSIPPTLTLMTPLRLESTARTHTEIAQMNISMSADVDVNVRMGKRCSNRFLKQTRARLRIRETTA